MVIDTDWGMHAIHGARDRNAPEGSGLARLARGEDEARLYHQSQVAAVDRIEAICRDEGIDCQFRRLDGFLVPTEEGPVADLAEEYDSCRAIGVEVEWAERAPIPGLDSGRCLRFPNQGRFHPTKYLRGLAQAIQGSGAEVSVVDHLLCAPGPLRCESGADVLLHRGVVERLHHQLPRLCRPQSARGPPQRHDHVVLGLELVDLLFGVALETVGGHHRRMHQYDDSKLALHSANQLRRL